MESSPSAEPRDTRVYILEQSIPLFAARGYSGVSMRNISAVVGISAASIYHHFSDKEALYLAAMEYAFADKASGITESVTETGTPSDRLQLFVQRFTEFMANDPDFCMLLQRELLDGDEPRLKLLAEQVFKEPFEAITSLARELAPDCDPHLLAVSMAGLVLFHFETAPIRKFLPGGQSEHNDASVVARHVSQLLLMALGNK